MIEIKAKSGKFHELYQTLHALVPTIRKENGCQDCRIYTDEAGEQVFFLSVNWEALSHLEHYIRSSSGSALLGAIELLGEKVRVGIGNEALLEGTEILKRMRENR
ncbi:MAG: antibiotic biosynthesis monooxygenase [Syntrophales bacterium]